MSTSQNRFSDIHSDESLRLPPVKVRLPTLTWHMAFWIARSKRSAANADQWYKAQEFLKKDLDETKSNIDSLFVSLFSELVNSSYASDVAIFPSNNSEIVLLSNVYLLKSNVRDDNNQPNKFLQIVDEQDQSSVHSSYLDSDQRVIILQFRTSKYQIELRCEFHSEYFTICVLSDLGRESVELTKFTDSIVRPSQRSLSKEDVISNKNMFFFKFWSDLVSDLRANTGISDFLDSTNVFQHRFCDFRGMVVPYHVPESEIDDKHSRKDGKTQWGESICEKMLSFVTDRELYECTASFMANHTILYMSDLGRPAQEFPGVTIATYAMIVRQEPSPDVSPATRANDRGRVVHPALKKESFLHSQPNRWQVARVINRIHTLGTLRVAAIKNIQEIRQASKSLSLLDPFMNEARGNLKQSNIEALRSRFNDITRVFLEKDPTNAGLQYRIERSRYYVNQFRSNVLSLRIERLEGFQKYNDFVERKSGRVFDFIDRVGTRYERAANAMLLIEQNFLENRIDSTSSRLEANGNSLNEIQKWGEFALIGFFLPYYIVGLLDKSHLPGKDNLLTYVVPSVALLAFCFASVRFVEIDKSFSKMKLMRFLFMVSLYIMIGVLLIVFAKKIA